MWCYVISAPEYVCTGCRPSTWLCRPSTYRMPPLIDRQKIFKGGSHVSFCPSILGYFWLRGTKRDVRPPFKRIVCIYFKKWNLDYIALHFCLLIFLPNKHIIIAYVHLIFAVCPPYVRRMSADHPPYIRRMSAIVPPYWGCGSPSMIIIIYDYYYYYYYCYTKRSHWL